MEKSLLRFTTTGSVDDGKSTLIGRLLYETNNIPEDQYENVVRLSKKRNRSHIDFSFLLDGLESEREQGITIDVSYRYFQTDKRKFIVADTPGHEQYTRNMVTGASNSDLAIILIDARYGVQEQSKRHGIINSLLGITHLIVAINKMDLVDYSENVYNNIVNEYLEFSGKLKFNDITFIPISALVGDNITKTSENIPWYNGETLLSKLENVELKSKNNIDFRYSVQNVIRPNLDFRGFAGKILSGSIKKGQEILVLPSNKTATVKDIILYKESLEESKTPQSVIITLDKEIDISRGDMFVSPNNIPYISTNFSSMLCWLDENNFDKNKVYLLKHTSQKIPSYVNNIIYKLNVNNLHRIKTNDIKLNDIFKVNIETTKPIFFDEYFKNKNTGSFILIDPETNNTVAAGTIDKKINYKNDEKILSGGTPEIYDGVKGFVYWFTGLSGSGKSTIAFELSKLIQNDNKKVIILDGDNLRKGLCKDLGFSLEDRKENLRRIAEVSKIMSDNGIHVITAFITPTNNDREMIKEIIGDMYKEIFVDCSLQECEKRDVKGLYKKARNGELKQFTGISSPFDIPQNPSIIVNTIDMSLTECVYKILKGIK